MMAPNWRMPLEACAFPSADPGEDSGDDSHEGLLQTVNHPSPKQEAGTRRNVFVVLSIVGFLFGLGGVTPFHCAGGESKSS